MLVAVRVLIIPSTSEGAATLGRTVSHPTGCCGVGDQDGQSWRLADKCSRRGGILGKGNGGNGSWQMRTSLVLVWESAVGVGG